jgi:regulator of sigma E protease
MQTAGPLIIGVLAVALLILIHEIGHFAVARLFGMRVKRFSIGFFKPLIEWRPRGGETVYSIGAVPLGGYVAIDGLGPEDEVDPEDRRSYANQPAVARLAMIVAGPLANFLAAAVVYVVLFNVGFPAPVSTPHVGGVADGRPARAAGLRPGDLITTVAGEPVETWNEMAREVRRHRGTQIPLDVRRGAETVRLLVTPDPRSGIIGVTPATRLERTRPLESVGAGIATAALSTAGMALLIWHMATGERSTEDVSGPVGIVQIIIDAWREGWRAILALVAQLSISLCIFNFLPIPALDGGRVVFLAIEAVSRRRVNRTVEGYVHAAGFLLLIGLLLLVTYRDILKMLS